MQGFLISYFGAMKVKIKLDFTVHQAQRRGEGR